MEANNKNHHLYNSALQPFASSLRKEMTKAECCLWKYSLKGKKLRGYTFRRQRPVLNYIADFMCMELKLVIEVDGLTHHWEQTGQKDEQKQLDLEKAGFTVIHLADEEVLHHINAVVRFLEDWVDKHFPPGKTELPPPSPINRDHPPLESDSRDERLDGFLR